MRRNEHNSRKSCAYCVCEQLARENLCNTPRVLIALHFMLQVFFSSQSSIFPIRRGTNKRLLSTYFLNLKQFN